MTEAKVVGIRPTVNPLAPEIERHFREALELLDKQAAEAKVQGDVIQQALAESASVTVRAMRSTIDSVTEIAATFGQPTISDARWRELRSDHRRVAEHVAMASMDHLTGESRMRTWAIALALLFGFYVAGAVTILMIMGKITWPL
jgi:hypothetical protein